MPLIMIVLLLKIKVIKLSETIEILFHDNGPELSIEVVERMFEPFYTTKRGEGKMGLGLHIVYNQITQKLGGKIALLTCKKNGAHFKINTPHYIARLIVPLTKSLVKSSSNRKLYTLLMSISPLFHCCYRVNHCFSLFFHVDSSQVVHQNSHNIFSISIGAITLDQSLNL